MNGHKSFLIFLHMCFLINALEDLCTCIEVCTNASLFLIASLLMMFSSGNKVKGKIIWMSDHSATTTLIWSVKNRTKCINSLIHETKIHSLLAIVNRFKITKCVKQLIVQKQFGNTIIDMKIERYIFQEKAIEVHVDSLYVIADCIILQMKTKVYKNIMSEMNIFISNPMNSGKCENMSLIPKYS